MEQLSGSARPPGDGGGPDLASRATDMVEAVVDAVHDKAVRPALLVARAVVFGLIVVTMLAVVSVAAAVGLVRLLDVYAFGGRVWASDALLGFVCCVGGLVAWSRRRPAETPR